MVAIDQPGDHLTDGEGDDERIEFEAADEQTVDQADQRRQPECDHDRHHDAIVRRPAHLLTDTDHHDGTEGEGPRHAQVNPAGHDHEHLTESGDGEEGSEEGDGTEAR